jgi:membrane associated rhomboid family serine protease
VTRTATSFVNSIRGPLALIVILWVIQLFQYVTGIGLGQFGIFPRHPVGLRGIILSPFIHASQDLMHLINNSIPLFVSMSIILFFYRKIAWKSIFTIYLLTGFFVWLFGRSVLHIGASGVVYGLVAFIFWNGIFRRNIKSIVLALIITLLYSGMFLGILPNQPGISWESHLIGAFVGVAVSYYYRNHLEIDEEKYLMAEEDAREDFFLDRDVFEKTKVERDSENRTDDWFSNSSW